MGLLYGDEGDEEGLCYVVESERRALLIRGSFVERGASRSKLSSGVEHKHADHELMGDEEKNDEGDDDELDK